MHLLQEGFYHRDANEGIKCLFRALYTTEGVQAIV